LNELEKPISTFAKLSNSPEISPISPDSAIKIEISYRLSESDDVELSRQLEISKSDEHYTKELELVIYNLNEKHQKEIKKVYLEIEERENLFNEEIFKLSVELADLNKENLRFASENKSLKNRVKVLEQVLKEKNEEIDYLKGNERRYERSLEGLQNKVKGYERKSEKVSRASGSDMEYLVEDTEKLKILQERYDKCQEDFQSEKDIMLKEKENLEEIIQTLETELKEFQFPNKV
jgi:chromosome segregation ATPase